MLNGKEQVYVIDQDSLRTAAEYAQDELRTKMWEEQGKLIAVEKKVEKAKALNMVLVAELAKTNQMAVVRTAMEYMLHTTEIFYPATLDLEPIKRTLSAAEACVTTGLTRSDPLKTMQAVMDVERWICEAEEERMALDKKLETAMNMERWALEGKWKSMGVEEKVQKIETVPTSLLTEEELDEVKNVTRRLEDMIREENVARGQETEGYEDSE